MEPLGILYNSKFILTSLETNVVVVTGAFFKRHSFNKG